MPFGSGDPRLIWAHGVKCACPCSLRGTKRKGDDHAFRIYWPLYPRSDTLGKLGLPTTCAWRKSHSYFIHNRVSGRCDKRSFAGFVVFPHLWRSQACGQHSGRNLDDFACLLEGGHLTAVPFVCHWIASLLLERTECEVYTVSEKKQRGIQGFICGMSWSPGLLAETSVLDA